MNTRDMLKLEYPDAPEETLEVMAAMRDAGQEGFSALADLCEKTANEGEWVAALVIRNRKHGLISYATVGGATINDLGEMLNQVRQANINIAEERAGNTLH